MFTGIVEDKGRVEAIATGRGATRLTVASHLSEHLEVGDSLAVNGVCLTATELDGTRCAFDVVSETLSRSNLGDLSLGDLVNLERPMAANARFDGHIVQGHVDGLGVVTSISVEGDGRRLTIEVEAELSRYIVEKGSVTINGVSLTVASVEDPAFDIAIIPHTLAVTNLSTLSPGDRVNVEVDVIAKYVERMMERRS